MSSILSAFSGLFLALGAFVYLLNFLSSLASLP